MPHANPARYAQALGVLISSDRGINQLIGHRIGQIFPAVIGDELQHQVNRRRSPRSGHAVAIDHKDRFGQFNLVEFFGKAVRVFPVDRGLLIVQQPGARQRVGRRAKPTHRQPFARFATYPAQQLFGGGVLHVNSAANHDRVIAVQLVQPAVDRKHCTRRTAHRFAVFA